MSNKLNTYMILSVAIIFWGLSFIGTKIALKSFSIFSYIFIRFAIASIIFLFIILFKKIPKLNLRDHYNLIVLALFEPTLYFIFETNGLSHISATTASLIIATVPIVIMILAHFILKEFITQRKFIGIILSFIGVILLVTGDPQFSLSFEKSIKGVFFLALAVLCAAFYSVITRNLGSKLSAITITSFQIFYGTILLSPFFLFDLFNIQIEKISLEAIWAILFLALFSTVAAFLAYNYTLTKITASQTAVFLNAIPVVTVIAACLILGENLTLQQASGGLIILSALYITN